MKAKVLINDLLKLMIMTLCLYRSPQLLAAPAVSHCA